MPMPESNIMTVARAKQHVWGSVDHPQGNTLTRFLAKIRMLRTIRALSERSAPGR